MFMLVPYQHSNVPRVILLSRPAAATRVRAPGAAESLMRALRRAAGPATLRGRIRRQRD